VLDKAEESKDDPEKERETHREETNNSSVIGMGKYFIGLN
jgi:hypothetical protein